MSNVPVAPGLELSTEPVTGTAYVSRALVTANMQALCVKPTVVDAGIRGVGIPPIGVGISLVYVLSLVGTGLYFLFYFLLSA